MEGCEREREDLQVTTPVPRHSLHFPRPSSCAEATGARETRGRKRPHAPRSLAAATLLVSFRVSKNLPLLLGRTSDTAPVRSPTPLLQLHEQQCVLSSPKLTFRPSFGFAFVVCDLCGLLDERGGFVGRALSAPLVGPALVLPLPFCFAPCWRSMACPSTTPCAQALALACDWWLVASPSCKSHPKSQIIKRSYMKRL